MDRQIYDAERTKNRPLASGRVTVLSASVFLLFQFAAGYVAFVRYNKSACVISFGILKHYKWIHDQQLPDSNATNAPALCDLSLHEESHTLATGLARDRN